MSDRTKHILAYINGVGSLVNMIVRKMPGDTDMQEARRKYILAKNNEDEFVKITGPHIYKFRELISSQKFEKILEINYEEIIDSNVKNENDKSFVRDVIKKIKASANNFNDAERTMVCSVLSGILSDYSKFLLLEIGNK